MLYALDPLGRRRRRRMALFVAFFGVILSMYGGGFATVPAYLADIFGTKFVGAIHGRLLTAWSAAGIFGPVLVNYIREYQLDHGMARASVYNVTMYILAGLLVVGFICNWLVRPVPEKYHMKEEPAEARPLAGTVARSDRGRRIAERQPGNRRAGLGRGMDPDWVGRLDDAHQSGGAVPLIAPQCASADELGHHRLFERAEREQALADDEVEVRLLVELVAERKLGARA